MYFIAFLMTVLAFWQHRANIGRLLHGNERKTFLFKKKDASAEQQAEEKNR
jgi:glycerol-3-phosphate acyltransferase PlsY